MNKLIEKIKDFKWLVLGFTILMVGSLIISNISTKKERVIHIYNWVDFFAPNTLKKFEKQTGIKVVLDTFDSNEVLEAKLFAGKTGYDVVFPSTRPYFQRMVKAGIFHKLDVSKLPNHKHIDPELMQKLVGTSIDNTYGIPYLWGTSGIGYNIDVLKKVFGDKIPETWGLLFDPKVVSKFYNHGVSMLDVASELIPPIFAYLGLDPNSSNYQDVDKAMAALKNVRKYIKKFDGFQHLQDLAKGEVCIAQSWSGEVRLARDRAKESNNGINIGYIVPTEGAAIACEVAAIPVDAPHLKEAYEFLDFLMQPEIIADISKALFYANANKASKSLLPKNLLEDPIVYPSAEILNRLFDNQVHDDDFETYRTNKLTRAIMLND